MSEAEPTITASRTVRFSLGNYEHVETTRIIKDIPGDEDPANIDSMLDNLMAGDILRARNATSYDAPDEDGRADTSVYYWYQLMETEGHI